VRVSVIIPAFNEERLLPATLAAIQQARSAFERRGWEADIIVCDNNSTDRTGETARAGGARVVFEPINQISRARNTGAAAATGDWLLFVDADSQPCERLFAEVAEQIQAGDCLAGGCLVRMDENTPMIQRGAGLWNWLSRRFCLLAGSFIFCEAAAFRALGGFSQDLFASEELDLTKRLKVLARRQGKRLVILETYPLLTSARKTHLYTPREYLWFLARVILSGGQALRSRENCQPWYDGRR
jgi:glycosyltransferase involved in cell wall biosynthesis